MSAKLQYGALRPVDGANLVRQDVCNDFPDELSETDAENLHLSGQQQAPTMVPGSQSTWITKSLLT